MELEHQQYGYLIERTAKLMKQHLQRKFNELQLGITVDQWLILDVLHQSDGLSQFEIANKTHKDPPTVTRIIDLLSKKKLIHREMDQEDRRRFKIHLTSEGKDKIEQVIPIVKNYRKRGWNRLSEGDYERLKVILTTIQENFS